MHSELVKLKDRIKGK